MHCVARGHTAPGEVDRGMAPACHVPFFAPTLRAASCRLTQEVPGFAGTQRPPTCTPASGSPLSQCNACTGSDLPCSWALLQGRLLPSLDPAAFPHPLGTECLNYLIFFGQSQVSERVPLFLSVNEGTQPRQACHLKDQRWSIPLYCHSLSLLRQ